MGEPGKHVVADVSDMDVQGEVAVGEFVNPDGIVEVASGFAVDGDDFHVAEILSVVLALRLGSAGEMLWACWMTSEGKRWRQVVFADGDFDVDAEVVGAAEDLDDPPDGGVAVLAETRGPRRRR